MTQNPMHFSQNLKSAGSSGIILGGGVPGAGPGLGFGSTPKNVGATLFLRGTMGTSSDDSAKVSAGEISRGGGCFLVMKLVECPPFLIVKFVMKRVFSFCLCHRNFLIFLRDGQKYLFELVPCFLIRYSILHTPENHW